MGDVPYEDRHTEFVTSKHGTTPSDVLQLLLSISLTPLLSSLIIPWIVPASFAKLSLQAPFLQFFVRAVVEYPIVAIAPLMFITTLAGDDNASWTFNVLVVVLSLCVGLPVTNHAITQPTWKGFEELWNSIKNKSIDWSSNFALVESGMSCDNEELKPKQKQLKEQRKGKYPFITNYRAMVNYITVLSILAVDFTIFPRRFAKTKMFGVSLMDVGTGCFVFSNGIVSPESKNNYSSPKKSVITSIPLIILGLGRLLTVKGIEYHEVVEEYGVHWNFFFTLAAVKILGSLVFWVTKPTSTLKSAIFCGVVYEILLVTTGLQNEYILNSKIGRNGLIDANREGIFSVFGYLVIYISSVYCGKFIYMENRETVRKWVIYCSQSLGQIILLWILFYASDLLGNPCSRRVANLSYILWSVAINYTLLWVQLFLSLVQICFQQWGLLHGPMIFYELSAKQTRDKEEQKKKFKEEHSVEKQAADIKEDKLIDEALRKVEEKLKNCEAEMSPESTEELEKIMKELDSEMKSIDEKLVKEENEKRMRESEKMNALVSLPDFARSPLLFEAICYNGLGVFLIGNVLTGLVNSLVYAAYVPKSMALFYLWCYASCITAASLSLYWFNIQIKFW